MNRSRMPGFCKPGRLVVRRGYNAGRTGLFALPAPPSERALDNSTDLAQANSRE
jgi:hypothetical protein